MGGSRSSRFGRRPPEFGCGIDGEEHGVLHAFVRCAVDLVFIRDINLAGADCLLPVVAEKVSQFASHHNPSVLPIGMGVRWNLLAGTNTPNRDAGMFRDDDFGDGRFLVREPDPFFNVKGALVRRGSSDVHSVV